MKDKITRTTRKYFQVNENEFSQCSFKMHISHKEEMFKSQIMIKIMIEISGLEKRPIKQKIIKAKSWFSKSLTNLTNPKLD